MKNTGKQKIINFADTIENVPVTDETFDGNFNEENRFREDEIKESCKSVIGNPEYSIVSKNKLMKIMLDKIEELEKGSEE